MGEPCEGTSKLQVAAIVGPTAVGKTEAALEVADLLEAEIVSCDSMQAYRGMDIGTAKPSVRQRALVTHHMVDIVDPFYELTASEFQARARAAIDDISRRGRLPLLVGGSGLYFRSVVDDLRFPPHDPEVRQRLEKEARSLGVEGLRDRLERLDPEAAARIERGNLRRTVRALEVIEITGRRFSDGYAWRRQSRYELSVVGLSRPRAELYERIGRRARTMLQDGLIDETKRLASRGLSRTAREALGYKQILHAPAGAPRADLEAEITRATKRFARRQESWFRADPRITWLSAAAADCSERVVAELRRAGT